MSCERGCSFLRSTGAVPAEFIDHLLPEERTFGSAMQQVSRVYRLRSAIGIRSLTTTRRTDVTVEVGALSTVASAYRRPRLARAAARAISRLNTIL